MPGPNAWTQIPTTLLDLGQKTQDAESWAAGQRAQLAETWANAQRQAVQAMADTWQKGNDTQDSYQNGYQGAPEGATGLPAPLGYNDMAGASSSGSAPGFGVNPQDVTSPIDRARNVVGASSSPSPFTQDWPSVTVPSANPAPQPLPQLLGGDQLLTDLGNQIVQGQRGRMANLDYRSFPTLGTRTDQPAREQVNRPYNPVDIQSGMTPSQLTAQAQAGADMALGTVSGVPEGAGKIVGSVPRNLADQGISALYHETSPAQAVQMATSLPTHQGLLGLNVSPSKDLALGQGGKGAIVEIGNTHQIQGIPLTSKPGAEFVNAQAGRPTELEIRNNAPASAIKSITFRPDAVIPKTVPPMLKRAGWTITRDAEGVHATNPAFADATQAAPAATPKPLSDLTQGDVLDIRGQRVTVYSNDGGGHYVIEDAKGDYQAIDLTSPHYPSGTVRVVSQSADLAVHPPGWQPESGSAGMGGPPPTEPPPSGQIPTPENPNARAGNILLRKYNVDPEVQQVIADAAAKDPQAMEAARRGVVSDATVQQLADAAGTTVGKVIARWKPGDAANAETIQALRTALDGKAREVIDAQQAIQGGQNTTANQLRLQLAIKEHLAVQQAVSGVTAEAGRGLRALRQSVTQALASNDVGRMQGLLKKLGGAEWTDELAGKLAQLDTGDPTQVATFLRDIGKAKAPDYINEWLYNAILSNPSTHIANSISNTVNALLGPVERFGAAAVDVPLAAIQGRPRGRFFGEAHANAYGLLQGLPEGLRAFAYAMQHGFSELSAMKGEMPRPQAFKGPIGNAINIPSRLLTAADAFFQPIMHRGALNAEIFRKAASEGLSGQALVDRITELTANVPTELMDRAGKMADYQLYRQEPGKFGAWLSEGRDKWGIGPVRPLRFVLPFVQVPINATKYGLERSPLGFLNPDLWGKMGALARRDPAAADMLARAGMGSLVTAAIASQVASGNLDITGAVPQSPAAKDAFYRQGKLPFSLKIGGKWYSYQRWEPFNHPLTQVAAGIDAVRNAKEGADPVSIAGQAALTIGQNVLTQTFLSGIGSLINAATDPARYGESFIAQLETSMVPASSAMRAAANTMDPRQRSPKGIVENVENITPGLSRNVPSRLNNYGEEQGLPGSPFLPYKSQTANDSPLEMELARLRVEPGAAGKSVRGIDLTRQENQDYQRLSGGLVKTALTQVMQDPRYRQLDDTRKAAALTRIIGHAKDLAAQRFIGQLAAAQGKDALLQRIAAKKRAALPRAG